jgi:hypothetical protein
MNEILRDYFSVEYYRCVAPNGDLWGSGEVSFTPDGDPHALRQSAVSVLAKAGASFNWRWTAEQDKLRALRPQLADRAAALRDLLWGSQDRVQKMFGRIAAEVAQIAAPGMLDNSSLAVLLRLRFVTDELGNFKLVGGSCFVTPMNREAALVSWSFSSEERHGRFVDECPRTDDTLFYEDVQEAVSPIIAAALEAAFGTTTQMAAD